MVGVTAPAGYGKSTLLAEWARAEDRRVAWVSLDRFDDDPAALLDLAGVGLRADLARATPTWSPTCAVSACPCWAAPRRASRRRSGRARSRSCSCWTTCTSCGRRPATTCWAWSSPGSRRARSWSPPVAPSSPTCRGCGPRVTRWSSLADDLALDAAGAEQIFAAAQRQPHRASGGRGDRTDRGLAGRPVPRRDDRPGQRRRGVDGLRRRPVRGRLPLPRVVGPAAREHAAVPAAHRGARSAVRAAVRRRSSAKPGAQERLRGLEASNLFLVPLDRRREWYRYHALFREFLLGELRRVEPDVDREAAPAGRRLVRGQRIPGDGPRAPAEHDRAGPLRPAGDRS